MVYILLAPGFEESEGLVPADLLRQAQVDTALVSLSGKTVTGGHNITVCTDLELSQVDLDQVENQRLRRYLLNYLEIVTTVSCVLLYRSGTPEHLEMERRFWQDMERDYPRHYALLSRRMFGRVLGAQNAAARRFTLAVYRLSQKIFGFN